MRRPALVVSEPESSQCGTRSWQFRATISAQVTPRQRRWRKDSTLLMAIAPGLTAAPLAFRYSSTSLDLAPAAKCSLAMRPIASLFAVVSRRTRALPLLGLTLQLQWLPSEQ